MKNNNNKHSLRSNRKGYGGNTHYTDSHNSDTTALSGRELYHLQFSLQADSPETFGHTLALGTNLSSPRILIFVQVQQLATLFTARDIHSVMKESHIYSV
jgi:hypothetical protein